ncbi:MAG: J domain-containing protein [Anaerolineae bacterium]
MTQLPKTVFKNWLHEELSALVSVQRCRFGHGETAGSIIREPELVVQMWAGVIIHIHVIDEPIPVKKVRRIVETATEQGIPSLFILDVQLLPQQNQHIDPEKWFVPIQSLMDDHAYSYQVEPNRVSILPVQFRPVSRYEVKTVYGKPISIRALRHSRITIKQAALKGFWLLADLESDTIANAPPIRRTDYSAYQYNGPRAGFRDMPHWENRNQPRTDSSGPPAKSHLEVCYELLGVTRSANREEVKAAFRKLAFTVHPDVSALPKPEAEARFKSLTEAYAYIKLTQGWD